MPVLRLDNVSKHFALDASHRVVAVHGLSLQVQAQETVALVGESGCGKSTVGKLALGWYTPTQGQVYLNGVSWQQASATQRQQLSRQAQLIFQDPYSSLNPRWRVLDSLVEPLRLAHKKPWWPAPSVSHFDQQAQALLDSVGLSPSLRHRYPHELSGGQRQRVVIARALALNPRFVVADEPLSALDVSIQAQMMQLLAQLQHDRGLSYLLISHDLAVVRQLAHRVGVMYLGQLVELASTADLYRNPQHPYTQALLASAPRLYASQRSQAPLLSGELPSPFHRPSGCAFCSRCPKAMDICTQTAPTLRTLPDSTHAVACHMAEGAEPPGASS